MKNNPLLVLLLLALLVLTGCSIVDYRAKDPATNAEYALKITSFGVKREVKKMTIGGSTIEGFSSDQVEAVRVALEAGLAAGKAASIGTK